MKSKTIKSGCKLYSWCTWNQWMLAIISWTKLIKHNRTNNVIFWAILIMVVKCPNTPKRVIQLNLFWASINAKFHSEIPSQTKKKRRKKAWFRVDKYVNVYWWPLLLINWGRNDAFSWFFWQLVWNKQCITMRCVAMRCDITERNVKNK